MIGTTQGESMDIAGVLSSEIAGKIAMMKASVLTSAIEELDEVASKVAETGDPAYILELSPTALALFNNKG